VAKNKFPRLILFILLLVSGPSLPAKTKEKLVFCVDHWEGLTNKDGTGSYSEVVRKVFEPRYKVIIRLAPWARSQKEFRNKKCDALIAENKIDSRFIKPAILLDALELEAYFLKGKLKFDKNKSLRQLQLGWQRGYGYNKIIPFPVRFTEFNNVHAGFKMLEGERFDVMLDYSYTFKDECKTSGANCAKIDSAPSGIIEKAYVVFNNNKNGRRLSRFWDEKMELLIQAGTVQEIFAKHDQKYPEL
jgi:hypothetical protein